LPISVDPNGSPVRAAPPGVVGDVDVGVDDEAILLEPEPHIPDIPDVSSIPEVVDIPDVADIPDEVDIPDVAAVAGAADPAAMPPPSKLAVDPNIDDGEVPKVEHVVPLLGIAMVPVTVGAGLTPGDAISVEPRGMPVWDTAEPVPKPSGEVAPIVGVGLAMPLTCAVAALQTTSAGRIAAINENLIVILRLKTAPPPRTPASIGFEMISLDARLSDIGQSPSGGSCSFEKISSGRCSSSCLAPRCSWLQRFGQVSWSGSWLAGPTCATKYEFMLLTPMLSRLTAKPIA
jgi:hypothetical protein